MPRALRVIVAACACALALSIGPQQVTPAAAGGCIRIYEIYYDSPGSDSGSNSSLNGEWIRLRNVCATGKSLTGWTIKDIAGHKYTFGTYTLKANGFVKVHTGSGTNSSTDRYWRSGWYIWNNDKDKATLRNRAGTLIAACSYSSTAVDYKFC